MKILGVGHALLDYFVFGADETPARWGLHLGSFNTLPQERMEALAGALSHPDAMAGGSAANTVKLAAQLGLEAAFAGKCGRDANGELFEQELRQAGVTVHLAHGTGPTGRCVTFISGSGRRTIATHRGDAGELGPDLVPESLLRQADLLVLEGYLVVNRELLYSLARRAKDLGKTVVFDPGNVLLAYDSREELLGFLESYVDVLLANEEEVLTLGGRELDESLRFLGGLCGTVVLKRGEKGCQVRSGGRTLTVPSRGAVLPEATGGGDGFAAGWLYGLAQGLDPETCARAGHAVAAEVLKVPGTRLDASLLEPLRRELASLSASGAP